MSSEQNLEGGAPAQTESLFRAHRPHSRVAIVGRPNVGKSTLFNYLTDSRKAVVKNQPGVTRDILIEPGEVWGTKFDVIDTGGLTEATDRFSTLIRAQVVEFLSSVDHIIVVMDGRAGLIPEDRDVVRLVKESGKPFLLVVNKVDRSFDLEIAKSDFYEFGVDVVAASFEMRLGMDAVLEWIVSQVKNTAHTLREGLKIALIGKPNVGKSSLCNQLLGEDRLLVSEIAGTTVDSVDTELVYRNQKFILIDTAGLRRQSRQTDDIEILASFKSRDAVARADLVLLLIDAETGPTSQDAKMLEACLDAHKAVIVVANKIDSARSARPAFQQWFREGIEREFHFFKDVPVQFVSAKMGWGLAVLFEEIVRVNEKLHIRIPTRELNDFFQNVIRQAPAPVYGNTNVKFFYLTQTHQTPPSFIAFANHPDGVDPTYRRFVIKRIQSHWGLEGIPVRLFCLGAFEGRRSSGLERAE